MKALSKVPAFNLKVAVEETGVNPDTLRAWERRYGLPNPKRTQGKHRLYSRYDVETIKWLVARQEEGMSISRAVKLWFRLIEQGEQPLMDYRPLAQEQSAAAPSTPTNQIDELRQMWVDACKQFDESTAEQALARAFALYPPETVCLQIIQQGVSEIGTEWANGKASVQQEHFASSLAMRRLNTLLTAAPAPTLSERIIVACPPEEDHAFAALLITLLLRYRGWEVVYLGANVPIEQLELTLKQVKPHLVVLTAQQLLTAASLLEIALFLKEEGVPLAFGGRIFTLISELSDHIPGHYLGVQIKDVPQRVSQILSGKIETPKRTPASESTARALAYFRQHQASLEAFLWPLLQTSHMSYEQFVKANLYLARHIIAALTLGDISYLNTEIDWLRQLRITYQWPKETFFTYVEAYHQAPLNI